MLKLCLLFLLSAGFLFNGLAYAENGRIVFFSARTGSYQIFVTTPEGTDTKQLLTSSAMDFPGGISPDEKKVVFASTRATGNTTQIYVANIDGTEVTRLTNNNFNDSSPTWSPDGTKVVFESDRDGGYDIYLMDADGKNQTLLTKHTAWDRSNK